MPSRKITGDVRFTVRLPRDNSGQLDIEPLYGAPATDRCYVSFGDQVIAGRRVRRRDIDVCALSCGAENDE